MYDTHYVIANDGIWGPFTLTQARVTANEVTPPGTVAHIVQTIEYVAVTPPSRTPGTQRQGVD